jgi:hypothetical protein
VFNVEKFMIEIVGNPSNWERESSDYQNKDKNVLMTEEIYAQVRVTIRTPG